MKKRIFGAGVSFIAALAMFAAVQASTAMAEDAPFKKATPAIIKDGASTQAAPARVKQGKAALADVPTYEAVLTDSKVVTPGGNTVPVF
ncbi:MAG TPA: hypothetical protein P5572_16135, partial [Phycisphaerae bacterium]|nr:hypothetical protein [Phycisphaerae bacterium]